MYVLPTLYFCLSLRTSSDFCPTQHKLIGFYNEAEKCLLRGTTRFFDLNGKCFVFKWLILCLTLLLKLLLFIAVVLNILHPLYFPVKEAM
jgi:hypothetical protein